MNENMVVRPVSPAPPESQGNMKEVGPQALAPRLAALLPACTGAAEFGAGIEAVTAREPRIGPRVADIPDPDVRGGKIVHALIAYELARYVGLDPETLDLVSMPQQRPKRSSTLA